MKKFVLFFAVFCFLFIEVEAQSSPTLENTVWYLSMVQGEDVPMCAEGTIYLNPNDMKTEGFAFCNRFLTDYIIYPDNQVIFPNFRTTYKHCAYPEFVMYFEYLFVTAIQIVNNYQIIDDKLLLFQDNNLLMEFGVIPPPPLLAGVSYSYDNSGNRILRETIRLSCDGSTKSGSGGKKKSSNEDMDYSENPIERKTDDFELKIYPNPTKGMLKVDVLGENEIQNALIEIYTVNGKMIYKTKEKRDSYHIDLSNQANGVYIMRVVLNNTPYEWKVIKE